MPEGNEVHRHATQHLELFGKRIITVEGPNGRFEEGAALLNRRRLRSVEAYGKHLFYDFGADRHLHIHLGLYGKFRTGELPFPELRGALRLRFSSRQHWLELRGPTACEILSTAEREKLVARIGPDPLREDAESSAAIDRILASRAPIGGLLMDQSVISGIGNIYRAELLFRARLNPFRAGNSLSKRELLKLWKEARELLRAGMIDRRIVTTRPADRPHPKGTARRGETHYVYRRHHLPCFVCGGEISREEFIGRKLYWCPECQPAVAGGRSVRKQHLLSA